MNYKNVSNKKKNTIAIVVALVFFSSISWNYCRSWLCFRLVG